jgi:mannose-6-phosphate isomerase-like protein (cupin superfamily)
MAINLEGGCRVSEMRAGECLSEGTLSIWNRIGRTSGAQAISLRIMEFAPGLSPGIRNGECDEILYVLSESHWTSTASDSGRVGESSQGQILDAPMDQSPIIDQTAEGSRRSLQIFIDGTLYDIDSDTGIYIRPHETFAINNPGPNSIVLVSSRCPEPDDAAELVTTSTSTAQSPRSRERGRLVRTAPQVRPKVAPMVRLADRRAQPTADRWYRVLVDDELGSQQATQFVGSIPPGRAPDHFHEYEEVLFILKGEGRMWAGDTNTPIATGSCIYLPKSQTHCVENTGEDELRLLGVFYPAGSPSVRYEV